MPRLKWGHHPLYALLCHLPHLWEKDKLLILE